MLSRFSTRSSRPRWVYPMISLLVAVGLWLGQPVIAQAISIGDLILRGVQVVQLSSISDKQEVALGQQINGQLSRQVRISSDRGITEYVNQIGQQLAKNSARPQIPYTFQVVDDNGINAFATMGGFVYVNKGLLQAADNEAQLASVMGHEIGHIVGRHSINQMKEAAIASGVIGAAGLNRNAAVNIGVELALRRPHSRKAEYEADQLGIKNLGKTGYAQSAAPAFMSKLMKQSSPPTFFSTHPSASDRVARLQQQVEPGRGTGKGLDGTAYKAKVRSFL